MVLGIAPPSLCVRDRSNTAMSSEYPKSTAPEKHEALVSVVIPTHNRAELVVRAIRSVLAQTYRNLECIVVDDASTDHTSDAVCTMPDSRLIYLRHQQAKQASATRNTGIAAAKGEYIAFLDDDDEWSPEKLVKQVALLQALPATVGMVYCWMDYYSDQGLVSHHHPMLKGGIFAQVLDTQPIGNSSTLLVRRAAIDHVGGFDETLPRGNDGDFIRRICRDFDVDLVPEVLVRAYVAHGFERITGSDQKAIENGLRSQLVKLEKFNVELQRYRRQKANILALVGYDYARLARWGESLRFLSRAVLTHPFSGAVYRHLLKSVQAAISRSTRRVTVSAGGSR